MAGIVGECWLVRGEFIVVSLVFVFKIILLCRDDTNVLRITQSPALITKGTQSAGWEYGVLRGWPRVVCVDAGGGGSKILAGCRGLLATCGVWVLLRAGMTCRVCGYSGWVRAWHLCGRLLLLRGLGALAGRMSQGVYFPLCGSLGMRAGLCCCLCVGVCGGVLFSLVLFACV